MRCCWRAAAWGCLALSGFALAQMGSAVVGPCDILGVSSVPCVAAHSVVRALFGAYSGALYQVSLWDGWREAERFFLAESSVFECLGCTGPCPPHPPTSPVEAAPVPASLRGRTLGQVTPGTSNHPSIHAIPVTQVQRASDNATLDINVLVPGGYADAPSQDAFCASVPCHITCIYDQSVNANHLRVAPAGGHVHVPDSPVNATALPTRVGGHDVYGASFEGKMGYRSVPLRPAPHARLRCRPCSVL